MCVFLWFILSFFLMVCLSVTVKWFAVKTASKMTYTMSGGALNSAQSNPNPFSVIHTSTVGEKKEENCVCVCLCPGAYPGYGVLPPELARDAAAAAAAAAAASMSHLAGLGSLSPGGLAYARAAMVCLHLTCAHILLVVTSNYIFLQKKCISPTQFQFVILLFCGYQPKAVEQPSSWS